MTARGVTTIAVLTLAAMGSWYLARSGDPDPVTAQAADAVQQGYYLRQARILGTAGDGHLLYEIEAAHAEQMSDARVEFTEVRIRYTDDSRIPWRLRADAATLQEGSPRITLRGHVTALSSGASAAEETEIRTGYLELDPERFIAETDDKVQIRFGGRSLTATGMLASLNEQKIQLKSNVRGKIAP